MPYMIKGSPKNPIRIFEGNENTEFLKKLKEEVVDADTGEKVELKIKLPFTAVNFRSSKDPLTGMNITTKEEFKMPREAFTPIEKQEIVKEHLRDTDKTEKVEIKKIESYKRKKRGKKNAK